jgi:hypothetical protein
MMASALSASQRLPEPLKRAVNVLQVASVGPMPICQQRQVGKASARQRHERDVAEPYLVDPARWLGLQEQVGTVAQGVPTLGGPRAKRPRLNSLQNKERERREGQQQAKRRSCSPCCKPVPRYCPTAVRLSTLHGVSKAHSINRG